MTAGRPTAGEQLVVVWRVTESCDLACGFCAYDRRRRMRRRSADVEAVRTGAAELVAFRERTGRSVLISWLGGEPYLWPPLLEVSRELRHDLGLDLSATTNGRTLDRPEIQRHVLEDLCELTVSVDGVGETHDQLRSWPGGFEHLRRTVPELAEAVASKGRDLLLRANVVLMERNLRELPQLCRELASWGVAEVTVNQLGGRDRPAFHRRERLSPASARWLARTLPSLQDELRPRGVVLLGGASYLERIQASAEGRRLPVASCRTADRFLFVDEVGRVAPCSFTTAELGTCLSVALEGLFPAAGQLPVCRDCPSTQVAGKFEARGLQDASSRRVSISSSISATSST